VETVVAAVTATKDVEDRRAIYPGH
jgi:hypothetical protein